jgi:hypothetical protein
MEDCHATKEGSTTLHLEGEAFDKDARNRPLLTEHPDICGEAAICGAEICSLIGFAGDCSQ